jgi:HEAT repeat protein
MALSLEEHGGRWDAYLPHHGAIYNLVRAALPGSAAPERLRAVAALGESEDPRAVRPLIDLLGDPDPEIRLSAIIALGHLKSGRPVDDLISKLRDRDEKKVIREQAIMALCAIRSTGALRGLREFVVDEGEDMALRSCAASQLKGVSSW